MSGIPVVKAPDSVYSATMQTSLPVIRALARSGAVDMAWAAFEEAGWHERADLPEALCLKGRLLKDRAARAEPGRRGAWLDAAIAAYLAAFDLSPATYPLINAATLALLADDRSRSAKLAAETLSLLDSGAHEPETPYWLAATRAEALLLLGDVAGASAMVAKALALAPQAWEDHGSTLVQFTRIAAHLAIAAPWLEDLRPPASLSYQGSMALAPDDEAARARIGAVFDRERPGFLYGALAAGADILVAEAGIRRGARLHVLLPASLQAFRDLSVIPFGAEWGLRFDALCAAAESVESVETPGTPSVASVALAQSMARGLAALQARELQSRVLNLQIDGLPLDRAREALPPSASGVQTIRVACAVSADPDQSPLADDQHLLALIAWAEGGPCEPDAGDALWRDLSDGIWVAAYRDLHVAVAAARALGSDLSRPIGLDYVLAPVVPAPVGETAARARAIARSARPGQWLASRPMALSLVGEMGDLTIQPVGEVRSASQAIEVYAVGKG